MPIYQKMCILQFFPISRDFSQNFYYFTHKMASFGPIQLDIIANTVSKIMNYQYAKCHDFIKKFTIDVITLM